MPSYRAGRPDQHPPNIMTDRTHSISRPLPEIRRDAAFLLKSEGITPFPPLTHPALSKAVCRYHDACSSWAHCKGAPTAKECTGVQQGAGVEELLQAFDVVRERHENMDAKEFNRDATYKDGLNQVRVVVRLVFV